MQNYKSTGEYTRFFSVAATPKDPTEKTIETITSETTTTPPPPPTIITTTTPTTTTTESPTTTTSVMSTRTFGNTTTNLTTSGAPCGLQGGPCVGLINAILLTSTVLYGK